MAKKKDRRMQYSEEDMSDLHFSAQELNFSGLFNCATELDNFRITANTLNTTDIDWDIKKAKAFIINAQTWESAGTNTIDAKQAGALVNWNIQNDLTLNNLEKIYKDFDKNLDVKRCLLFGSNSKIRRVING